MSDEPWLMKKSKEDFDVTKKRKSSILSYFNENGAEKKGRPARVKVERNYEKLMIAGIEISLPVGIQPYPTQKLMMVKMIQALKNKQNAMIESPTGSGKTLALLSPACAWLVGYKKQRMESKKSCPRHGVIKPKVEDEEESDQEEYTKSKPVKEEPNQELDKSVLVKEEPNDTLVATISTKPDVYDEHDKDFLPLHDSENIENVKPSKTDILSMDMKPSKMDMKPLKMDMKPSKMDTSLIDDKEKLNRSHTKLEQSFSKTPVLPDCTCLPHTILASREQTCINPSVRGKPDTTEKCQLLIKGEGQHNDDKVWDVEDLVTTLESARISCCPYFASNRNLVVDADIVFCPFNYLIDPIIRESSDVYPKNSIIILDEAHNVEDICREAASFEFQENDLTLTLGNIEEKCKFFLYVNRNTEFDEANFLTEVSPEEIVPYLQEYEKALRVLHSFANDIRNWFSKLLELESNGLQSRKSYGDGASFTLGHEDLYKSLMQCGMFLPKDCDKRMLLRTAFNMVCGKSGRCNVSSTPLSLSKPLFRGRNQKKPLGPTQGLSKTQLRATSESTSNQVLTKYEPLRPGNNICVKLWCMVPSLAFVDAFYDCRSVVLASGTLCPTDTFKTELGLEFHSQMEGEQVIEKDRIFATVLSNGPSGQRLNASFNNIQAGSDFMYELADLVVSVCLTVPKGVLCFLSSYRVLDFLSDALRMRADLRKRKKVFEEPRRSTDLRDIMSEYNHVIDNPKINGPTCDGALMLAVFRGKVSEGIDFADDKARCVICVGIPFPNAYDELVLQKKRFNSEYSRFTKVLNGEEWYTTQAYRALNQALGRCLRHRMDWGALLLVDERNSNSTEAKKISRWVRQQLLIYDDFASFQDELKKFVEKHRNVNHIPQISDGIAQFKAKPKPTPTLFL
ncbi:hypothetical protein Ddc_08140 [Ditylenchus destructor]|nr:hypothetical protein Ddc_08140 [Ditylenchus destructor]